MEQDYVDYGTLAAIMAPQTQALQAIAMRPQKTSAYTTTTSTPRALADMIANRDRIGTATRELDEALKARETLGYTLANALGGVPQQQGYGSWLSDLARGFGSGATMRTNAQIDRAQKAYDAQMKDLAEILAYDKAMGETQTQRQEMGYTPMEYGAAGGKGAGGAGQEVAEQEVYDFTQPAMPETPITWSELDIQGQKTDPQTNIPTLGGLVAKYTGAQLSPEGRYSKNANQQAYTQTFTVPTITKVAKAAGGSRGIDTIPEINIKGGPELSSANMTSSEFSSAVKDQAWDAADQIIKANPDARITREELANALINNFNHRIRKEYRIVQGFNAPQTTQQIAQPGGTATRQYDYSKYGF